MCCGNSQVTRLIMLKKRLIKLNLELKVVRAPQSAKAIRNMLLEVLII